MSAHPDTIKLAEAAGSNGTAFGPFITFTEDELQRFRNLVLEDAALQIEAALANQKQGHWVYEPGCKRSAFVVRELKKS